MRSDARANREALLAAARRLFGTRGVDVALAAVAEEAGTGIATLYRNFPTRDDLVRAVVLDFAERFIEIEARYSEQLDTDIEGGWHALVHELAALRPGALLPALVEVFAAEGVPPYVTETVQRVNQAQQALLDRVRAAGLVREEIGAIEFQVGLATVTRPLTESPGHVCADADSWLVDAYLRGIRPGPAPSTPVQED